MPSLGFLLTCYFLFRWRRGCWRRQEGLREGFRRHLAGRTGALRRRAEGPRGQGPRCAGFPAWRRRAQKGRPVLQLWWKPFPQGLQGQGAGRKLVVKYRVPLNTSLIQSLIKVVGILIHQRCFDINFIRGLWIQFPSEVVDTESIRGVEYIFTSMWCCI